MKDNDSEFLAYLRSLADHDAKSDRTKTEKLSFKQYMEDMIALETEKHQRFEHLRPVHAQQSLNPTATVWQSISSAAHLVGDALSDRISCKSGLETPPGFRLNSLAEFVYSKKVYERVFQPLIADVQCEYIEALHQERYSKARWIRWRGCIAFWAAVLARIPSSLAAWLKTVLVVAR